MFGFYFIKRFWNAKVTNLRMFHAPSTQNVKMFVYLRKRSHNRFSPRLWSEVNNTCRRSLTQRSASWSSPVAPKVLVETEITVAKCEKMGHAEAIQRSKKFGNRYSSYFSVSGWSFFIHGCLNNKIQSTGKKFSLVSF